jgi:hypothetical protein
MPTRLTDLKGRNCDWNQPDGGCEGYCDSKGVCQPFALENDDCSKKTCQPGLECRYTNTDNTFVCSKYFTAKLGESCTMSECGMGLTCNLTSFTCAQLSATGETCKYDTDCAGLDFCNDGTCQEFGTGKEGDSCSPWYNSLAFSSCSPGYQCGSDNTCVKTLGQACDGISSTCASGDGHNAKCLCDAKLSPASEIYGNATCALVPGADVANRVFRNVDQCQKRVSLG